MKTRVNYNVGNSSGTWSNTVSPYYEQGSRQNYYTKVMDRGDGSFTGSDDTIGQTDTFELDQLMGSNEGTWVRIGLNNGAGYTQAKAERIDAGAYCGPPTTSPTESPTTTSPTESPSVSPTVSPTTSPTDSESPTSAPTLAPTGSPTLLPTSAPTVDSFVTLEETCSQVRKKASCQKLVLDQGQSCQWSKAAGEKKRSCHAKATAPPTTPAPTRAPTPVPDVCSGKSRKWCNSKKQGKKHGCVWDAEELSCNPKDSA